VGLRSGLDAVAERKKSLIQQMNSKSEEICKVAKFLFGKYMYATGEHLRTCI